MTASLRALTAVSPSHQTARAAPVRPQRQPLHENELGPAVPRVATSLASLPAQPQPPSSPRAQARRVGASATPARPQRMCAECATEEEDKQSGHGTPVRPRLEVGPADDAYEREADTIAAETLSRPALPSMEQAGAISTSSETLSLSAQPLRIRRRCAACGAKEEEAQTRKRDKGAETAASGPPHLAASPTTLTSGGQGLPSATRYFFESRMGRDLSHVRVHEGGEAGRLNAGIDAHAFTYGSHIWLGQGEKADTGFTMAHELAHVLQQTQPREARARRKGLEASNAPRTIQRKELRTFWLPAGTTARAVGLHTVVHNKAADALVKASAAKASGQLIREAPIPGGNKGGSTAQPGLDAARIRGLADIYEGATTVGVQKNPTVAKDPTSNEPPIENFFGPRKNRPKVGSSLATFEHGKERAPKVEAKTKNLIDLPKAPTRIRIADVKPGHNLGERSDGVGQIKNYVGGINDVVAATNSYIQPSRTWTCDAAPMAAGGLTVSSGWDPGLAGKGAKSPKLKLRSNGKDVAVKTGKKGVATDIRGSWVITEDKTRPGTGIWTYFLLPDQASLDALLADPNVDQSFKEVATALQERVFADLLEAPKKPQLRRASSARAIVRRAPPKKKPTPKQKDNFDFRKWNNKRVGRKPEGKPSFKETFDERFKSEDRDLIELQHDVAESIRLIKDNFGETRETKGKDRIERQAKALKKFKFWVSPLGGVVGRLRQVFGRVFIAVWQLAAKAKETIGALLAKFEFKKGGAAKGWAGIAMRVAGKLLGIIGTMVVRNTVEALTNCFSTGIRKTIDGFVKAEFEELEQKVNAVKSFVEDAEKTIVSKLEKIFDDVIGPFQKKIEELQELAEDHKIILDLANAIETGIRTGRLVACLASAETGPGAAVVCGAMLADQLLSFVGLSPLDKLAEQLMQSCEAQEFLSDFVLAFDFIKEIPIKLGEPIRAKIQDLLPEPAKGIVCSADEFKKGVKKFEFKDLNCGKGSGSGSGTGTGTGGGSATPGGSQTGTGNAQEGSTEPGQAGEGKAGSGKTGGKGASSGKPKSGGKGGKLSTTQPIGPDEKGSGNQDYRILIQKGLPTAREMSGVDPKKGLTKKVEVWVRRVSTNKGTTIFQEITFFTMAEGRPAGTFDYKWDWAAGFKIEDLGILIRPGRVDGVYNGTPYED